MKGIILSGEFSSVLARQKSSSMFEIGELLISEQGEQKQLMQVVDLVYGSQLPQPQLELVSGLKLEEDTTLGLLDGKLRMYVLAKLKNILTIRGSKAYASKQLPIIFSPVRDLAPDDIGFITQPESPLPLGKLRSGSRTLDVPISVKGDDVLSHHVLIAGQTGRGKSVLMSNLLWNTLDADYCGMLVLDPHDEYFGRSGMGLKDHPSRDRLVYYTNRHHPGARSLLIPLHHLQPRHVTGVLAWSDAQKDAIYAYYKEFKDRWVEALLLGEVLRKVSVHESSIEVVKRKLMHLLSLDVAEDSLVPQGTFVLSGGDSILKDILKDLMKSRTVVVDTSDLSGSQELLVANLLAHEVLGTYRKMRAMDLRQAPVIGIVLEEAPRVLGQDVVERSDNVFGQIAREGRKFKVGLVAITQLPSLIPRQVLANLNTKIILGIELKQERDAIIQSAAQDLSQDDRAISSLDKGEAIITSTFLRFATPVTVPYFGDLVMQVLSKPKNSFGGMR